MLALAELQSRMRDTVLGGSADGLRGVVTDDRLGHARRLNVYRNNTTLLLCDALATQFPVIAELVGDDFFAHMAKAFVRTHPPQSPCLFEYGEAFADFIETFPGAQSLPYLADVARVEWARVCAVHAADAEFLNPALLASIAAEDYGHLTFIPHPASRVVTSPFPIHAIWTMHQADAEAPASIDLNAGFESVLITRPTWAVQIMRLEAGEDVFLHLLGRGIPLADAFNQGAASNAAFDPAQALTVLLTSGAFTTHALI